MKTLCKCLFILIFVSSTQAMKLFPIPITKQLNESDGVIFGEFLGDSYKRMHNGKIVTESSFKIIKSVGITEKYLINKSLFRVYYDGGVYNGFRYNNESAPRFKEGKSYMVLLKRTSYGFKPYMDKLGVYDLKSDRESTHLISQAFPKHPKIGIVPYNTFDLWIRTVYGSYMDSTHSDKFVYMPKKDTGRHPASTFQAEAEDETKIGIFWVALIFGFLGAMRLRQLRYSK